MSTGIARFISILSVYCAGCTGGLLLGSDAAAEEPARHRAPVNGGEIEYVVEGPADGEAVLFIHGGFIVDTFRPMAAEPAFAAYRRIRYARRGYAGSTERNEPFSLADEAADAVALLDHLGIERAHVVPHSAGGPVSLYLAVHYPERVQSLVLLEPALPQIEGGLPPAVQSAAPAVPPPPPLDFTALYEAGEHERIAEEFFAWFLGAEWRAVIERSMPGAREQTVADVPTEMPSRQAQGEEVGPDFYGSVDQPVLFVRGAESGAVWDFLGALIPLLIPHSESVSLPGLTHALLIEDPETVAEVTAAFIARYPM